MVKQSIWIGVVGFVFAAGGAMAKDGVKKDLDHEALGKKLKAAVASGELTEAEAKTKWIALTQKDKADPAVEVYFKESWAKLQAMVKAGKLTEKQAHAKMTAIKKAKLGGKGKSNLQLVWDALQTHVKAGHLTPQQADAAMTAIKKTDAKTKEK